jgi:2,3-bisphosphoglycerate-independent phosphoglycerate mutase
MKQITPTALVILDGFGYSPDQKNNAIYQADTPHLDAWYQTYPHTLLKASGRAVGLLDEYIGNSEVGHLTIGSGRIIEQPITTIHNAIKDKSFFDNRTLTTCLERVHKTGSALHIMGLLSDTGIHSHIEHLYALLDAANQHGVRHVFIHAFLDGRDTSPKSAAVYLEPLDAALSSFEYGSIASLHGRFYAMDRDNHWDRIERSYRVLAYGDNCVMRPWQEVIEHQYQQNITDEFIIPTQIDPTSTIENGDGIIFFNVREDRARELTASFIDPHFDHFKTKKISLSCFITPISYNSQLQTDILFDQQPIPHTLTQTLSEHNKTIFSIAETEKYAHISYFFSGKKEEPVAGETRILIPSVLAKDYTHHPCMSAPLITNAVCDSLKNDPRDFYLINYANADMVGHSGDFNATVKAIECLDTQLQRLYEIVVVSMNGTLYITADHGKAEQMVDERTHQPHTAHTNNHVPFIMLKQPIPKPDILRCVHELADIAPFILKQMNVPVPHEMNR